METLDPLAEVIDIVQSVLGDGGATIHAIRDGHEYEDFDTVPKVKVYHFPDIDLDGTIRLDQIGINVELYTAGEAISRMKSASLENHLLAQPTMQELMLTGNILPMFIYYRQLVKLGFSETICTSKTGELRLQI